MGDKRYRVGGTRGGQDQFKWEDVKDDAHRENYLGHSLLAPVGRWQRGKDLKWWSKKREGTAASAAADDARAQAEMEKARLKQMDEDLINEALGLGPRVVRSQQTELTKAEKRQLLEKGGTADRDGMDTERVSGLGTGQANHHEHIPTLTLKERELERLKKERERKEGGLTEASLVEIVDVEKERREKEARAAAANGSSGVTANRKRLREEKKAKKKEEKLAKKEKKRKKREKKKRKQMAKESERATPALPVPSDSAQPLTPSGRKTSNDRDNHHRPDNVRRDRSNISSGSSRSEAGRILDSRNRTTGVPHDRRDDESRHDDGGRRGRSPGMRNGRHDDHHTGPVHDGGKRARNDSRDDATDSGRRWSGRGRGNERDSSRKRLVIHSRSGSAGDRRGKGHEATGRHRHERRDDARGTPRNRPRDGSSREKRSPDRLQELSMRRARGSGRDAGIRSARGDERDSRSGVSERRDGPAARRRAARSPSSSADGNSSSGSSSSSSDSSRSSSSSGSGRRRMRDNTSERVGARKRSRSRSDEGKRSDSRNAKSPARRSTREGGGRASSRSFGDSDHGRRDRRDARRS